MEITVTVSEIGLASAICDRRDLAVRTFPAIFEIESMECSSAHSVGDCKCFHAMYIWLFFFFIRYNEQNYWRFDLVYYSI